MLELVCKLLPKRHPRYMQIYGILFIEEIEHMDAEVHACIDTS